MNAEDGQCMYLYNDGTGRKQPPTTRSSVLSIGAGQSISFGVYFGSLNLGPAWYGSPFAVTTSYVCHQ